ncbi:MAG: cellulase family glycosylhydrolase [Anaerolineae bacterium]
MFSKFNRLMSIVALLVLGVALVSVGVFLFARWQADPFAGDAINDPPFTPLSYSIQTFLWWDEGNASSQAGMVNRVLNFSYIKQTFPWRELEPRPDEWDFTQSDRIVALAEQWALQLVVRLGQSPDWASGLSSIDDDAHDAPPLELDDWAAYCATIAERYQGRIVAYQIWNEPNLQREWGEQAPDPTAYVDLLARCSDAIREADPQAIVISAGLSPTGGPMPIAMPDDQYLDAMYQADFQQYVDVVGVHAPGFAPPSYGPDDAEADNDPRWASFRRVEDLRKIMIRHDDAGRQMAILEFGYTTDTSNPDYSWFAVSEDLQAQYIVEAYQYASENWRPWIGLMNLIYLPDSQWTAEDEEWWWAIITPDGRARPAFFALAEMTRYCGERTVSGWTDAYVSEEDWLERRDTCP